MAVLPMTPPATGAAYPWARRMGPIPLAALILAAFASARALEITPYSSVTNDLFVSWGPEGFHQAPVLNTNAGFIGAGYDWTGVGWSSTLYSHNATLITPRHLATAAHYPMTGSSSGAVVFVGMDGQPVQVNPGGVYTSHDDSAIQSLLSTVPSAAKVAIYSVLDVGSQSLVGTTALVHGDWF